MKGIEYGTPTDNETKFIHYLGNCIADYIEKTPTDRSEILAAFTIFCTLMFTKQTPITDIEKQCQEIDAFCECLKLRARNEKR